MDSENTVGAPELAGYEHIAFARFDAEICIGRTLDEAVEFAVALGPAGEHISRRWSEQAKSPKPRSIVSERHSAAKVRRAPS